MIILKILSGILALFFLIKLIKDLVEYNKRYKSFVDFLRLENDLDTLKSIGYKEFYGEEYGLRKSYLLSTAKEQLTKQYNKTGKEEYKEFFKYISKKGYINIVYGILIFYV